jgi:hypothetical protein
MNPRIQTDLLFSHYSKMEINAGRHHMAVILKFLVDDILVTGFDLLQPEVPVSAVD